MANTDVVTEIIQNIPLCNTIDVIVDACPVNIIQSLEQVQSDWEETNQNSPAYIKNKPDLNAYAELEDISTVGLTGDYNDLENKPTIPEAQVNADWNSVSGVSEILNKPDLSIYQETLVSGENIKTINNQSLLGSGNIEIQGGGGGTQVQADWDEADPTSMAYINNKPDLTVYALESELQDYQPTLISGQNIKTINNESLLGSGNITIEAPEQQQANWNETDTTAPSYIQNKPDLSNYVQSSDLASVATTGDYNDLTNKPNLSQYATTQDLADKQDTLQSGVNIKTINNQSLLGSGNIDIQGGGGSSENTDILAEATIKQINDLEGNLTNVNNILDDIETTIDEITDTSTNSDEITTRALVDINSRILAAQVQANWNESDTSSLAYIQNKPTIPAAQVQANWNETDNTSLAYIQNKPTISDPGIVYYTNPTYQTRKGYVCKALIDNSSNFNTNIGNNALVIGAGDGTTTSKKIKAAGDCSISLGRATKASGNYSLSQGYYTETQNSYEIGLSIYNKSTKTNTTFGDSGNTLFSIGNGDSTATHNAFEVRQNGDIYYADTEKIDGSTVYYHTAPMRKLQDTMVTSTTAGVKIEVASALPASPDSNTIYLIV